MKILQKITEHVEPFAAIRTISGGWLSPILQAVMVNDNKQQMNPRTAVTGRAYVGET